MSLSVSARSVPVAPTSRQAAVALTKPTNSPRAPVDAFDAQATKASSPAIPTLEQGMSGPNVKAWQNQLVALGYLTAADVATGPGTFGPRTVAATTRFQKDFGLAVSGRVGSATRTTMKKTLDTISSWGGRTLGEGSSGPMVRVLKTLMVAKGLLHPSSLEKYPTEYGDFMATAVRQFQAARGLRVSGRVGEATFAALLKAAPGTPAPGAVQVGYLSQFDSAMPGSYCGPTTVAMIARAFGRLTSMSGPQAINTLANGAGIGAAGTGSDGVIAMARNAGLTTSQPMPGAPLEWIRQQLAAGRLVAANGNRGVTLDHASFNDGVAGGHWIVVCGVAANGDFLVQDPSTDCKRLSASELARYFNTHEYGGFSVAIGQP
ncbi:MAG: peptidoglycan-binding protein [Myxococcales bacterium]|nr:peptidoglycan-binding protein [Myxococcales bacterium]